MTTLHVIAPAAKKTWNATTATRWVTLPATARRGPTMSPAITATRSAILQGTAPREPRDE